MAIAIIHLRPTSKDYVGKKLKRISGAGRKE